MRRTLKQYLQLTRAEQLTAFGVFVVIFLLYAIPAWLPHRVDVPESELKQLLALLPPQDTLVSRSARMVTDTVSSKKEINYYPRESPAQDKPVTPQLAPFNPDTVTAEQWKTMGVPVFVAARMEKYRSKGGAFRQPADVGKIYGFPPELLSLLTPFMVFEESQPAVQEAEPSDFTYTGPVVEMNTATADDWKMLGFDNNEVVRLEKFRTQAGGFVSIDQLYNLYGIQAAHIQRAEPWLRADKNSVIKINLNAADSVTLAAHVYISDELAGAIVRYRKTTGKFYAVQEIAKVPGMYPALLEKLKPYLRL